PAVRLRNRDELGPRSRTVHADALSVWAKMTPPGQTISAMPAGDMTFANDEIAFGKTFDVIAYPIDFADELVTDCHRDGDCLLGPGIPVIYMYVGSADGGLENANEHIVAANFGHRPFLEPQTRLGFGFHDRLHHLLHDAKLSAHFAHVDLACRTIIRDDERPCP